MKIKHHIHKIKKIDMSRRRYNENIGMVIKKVPLPDKGCVYGIQGKRESMEDTTVYAQWICRPLESTKYKKPMVIRLYGVFDGHGGGTASVLVSQVIPYYIVSELNYVSLSNKASVKSALVASFEKMQNYMQTNFSQKYQNEGTTAVVILQIKNHIYCANAGDSRAVLCTTTTGGPQIADLSKDHKPNIPEEITRIYRLGGYVNPSSEGTARVWTSKDQTRVGLATSRSLGDLESRTASGKYLVSPIPEVTVNQLEKNEKGFIILACDGVWDVVTSPQACKIVAHYASKQKDYACKALVRYAYEKGSTDNISVMIIYI